MPYKDKKVAKQKAHERYQRNRTSTIERSKIRYQTRIKFGGICCDCGKKIKIDSVRCNPCSAKFKIKINPPTMLGKHHSEETKRKMSLAALGEKNHRYGTKHNAAFKLLMSNRMRGSNHPHYGIPMPLETKLKLIAANRERKGEKRCPCPIDRRQKISAKLIGKPVWITGKTAKNFPCISHGEKRYNWKGGYSYLRTMYDEKFSSEFKKRIRNRDEHKCKLCKTEEKNMNYKLNVHHIDYEKKNTCEENCISLCKSCHIKTNSNRKYWKELLIKTMGDITC
jgi:hypothetical protein